MSHVLISHTDILMRRMDPNEHHQHRNTCIRFFEEIFGKTLSGFLPFLNTLFYKSDTTKNKDFQHVLFDF